MPIQHEFLACDIQRMYCAIFSSSSLLTCVKQKSVSYRKNDRSPPDSVITAFQCIKEIHLTVETLEQTKEQIHEL
jgi:hypothetical protein